MDMETDMAVMDQPMDDMTMEDDMMMDDGETYDMDHSYGKPEMWTANLIWLALSGSLAFKSIMGGIVDADYTTHASATNYQFYQYGCMIMAYSGAIFWTVGTLLQLISLAWIAVDINIMFWAHSAMVMMAIEGIAELLMFYAYDGAKVAANAGTAADVAFIEEAEKEMVFEAAHTAWLTVTMMGLHDMWIAGQWDMLATDKRKMFVEMHEAKMKEQAQKNKEMMMEKMDMGEEEMEEMEEVEEAAVEITPDMELFRFFKF